MKRADWSGSKRTKISSGICCVKFGVVLQIKNCEKCKMPDERTCNFVTKFTNFGGCFVFFSLWSRSRIYSSQFPVLSALPSNLIRLFEPLALHPNCACAQWKWQQCYLLTETKNDQYSTLSSPTQNNSHSSPPVKVFVNSSAVLRFQFHGRKYEFRCYVVCWTFIFCLCFLFLV